MSEVHCGKIYCSYYDFAVMECAKVPDWDCPEAIEEENDELYADFYNDEEDERDN